MKTVLLLFLLTASGLTAQDIYTLDWSLITGGGQSADAGAGEFTVESTLGQVSAGTPAGGTSGEFGVSSGYWSFTLNEPLDLGLAMQITGSGVTLTWDDSSGIAVQLESSPDLQLWQAVYPQPQFPPFLDVTGARRHFYRLMPVP
jgi:hypothetical protein